ncbi:hypothetical protein BDQ17DRAFT_1363545 [Cyathus striatus]|nr:hypothetical protein BDQ17DRAFT_1363545 [Cyathus striatus]
MELSLEAYRNIVNNVDRADIATLCRVSKGFRHAAERALYNTLYLRNISQTILICDTLATTSRLSSLESESGSDEEEEEDSNDSDSLEADDYWQAIARALTHTYNLRHLNIHVSNGISPAAAWILNNATFQLKTFHCDLDWDQNLITFLNKQTELHDLYILDYNELNDATTPTVDIPIPTFTPLLPKALPKLSTLECTFTEAACALVSGRPITRLKTCFSRPDPEGRRVEMRSLLSKVRQSSQPLHALDIADSDYTEEFSMELLSAIVASKLQFYGLLMRLPRIQCVEVEVSEWLRLYSPTVNRVVFVHEFDRTVVTSFDGMCRIDNDVSTDILWRET